MFKIQYSPQALDDLQRLQVYITTNWGDSVSKKILTKITSDIRRLERYPMSGVNLGKNIDITTDYHYLFSEKNYVFYRIEIDKILIIRVISEKQDYLYQLFGKCSDTNEVGD